MAALSDYMEEQALNWLLGGTRYIGLALASAFTDSSYASEVSGSGYARVQLVDAFTIADAGGGQWQGKNTAEFAFALATGDYGSPPTDKVEGWGLFDSLTGDNFLAHGAFSTPFPIYAGMIVWFPALSLVIEAQ